MLCTKNHVNPDNHVNPVKMILVSGGEGLASQDLHDLQDLQDDYRPLIRSINTP